jgi:hypothetical protein
LDGGARGRVSRFAEVIELALQSDRRTEGERYQILLLDLDKGFQLKQPIDHPVEVGRSAWVQNQRYSRRDALETEPQPLTTADLGEAGGQSHSSACLALRT